MAWTARSRRVSASIAALGGLAALVLTPTAASADQARTPVTIAARAGQTIILNSGTYDIGGGQGITYRGGIDALRDTSGIAGLPAGARVVATSAGNNHALFLRDDGIVLGAGLNNYAQIGDLPTVGTMADNGLHPLGTGVAIAAGGSHSLILGADGRVSSIGRNAAGELGVVTSAGTETPVRTLQTVSGLTDVRAIAAGTLMSAAIRRDGTLWTWGWNLYGQLGRPANAGTITANPTASQVPGLADVLQVSIGEANTLALRADGTVWAFGSNYRGLLGIADGAGNIAAYRASPGLVPGLTNIVAVSVGGSSAAALRSDGTLFTWGTNRNGELGRPDGSGTDTVQPTPAPAILPSAAAAVAVGGTQTLVALRSGEVVGFGSPLAGALDGPGGWQYIVQSGGAVRLSNSLLPLLPFTKSTVSTGRTGTGAALVNLTMTEATRAGYVTADRCSALTAGPQTKSNGNYTPGASIANLAVVSFDGDGTVCIVNEQPVNLLVDIQGVFTTTGSDVFSPVGPTRLLDTRAGTKPAAGSVTIVQTGRVGASSALVNLTMSEADAPGYVTADLCSALTAGPQAKSNGNYTPGANIANLAVVPLDANGSFCIYSERSVQLLVDIQGTFAPGVGDRLTQAAPRRLVDTRSGAKPLAGSITTVQTGQVGASSALVNLTMSEAETAGYITADRCSALTAGPQAKSNGNFSVGSNIANLAVVPLDADGSFCIYTERSAQLLVDIQGTFTSGGSLGFDRVDSTRLIDTRLQ
jgi:alpha-tubulin suppressor-like RCC1 family protein